MNSNTNDKTGCLNVFFPFFKRSQNKTISKSLPYRIRDDFLSPAEFSFYKVLSSLVGTNITIQSKVRLADIFFVARPNKNITFFNRISQRHIDFLVCDSRRMKPLFGIELDDSSHSRRDRQERDEFVERVFQVAGLPLLRVPVQREYNTNDIFIKIVPFLKDDSDNLVELPKLQNNTLAGLPPICPKCGVPMVLRTAMQGEHKGQQFYGCKNFPSCHEVKYISQ